MAEDSILRLLRKQREQYFESQKFHYLMFGAFVLILVLDLIIIVGTKAVTLGGYAWTGIIFILVLISVEARQYFKYKGLKEEVDGFYLRGEYEQNKKNSKR